MRSYFPFHALGYRANPFRALTDEEWAKVAVLPPEIERLLPDEATHLQLLGDKGAGKTTTLLGLQRRLDQTGRVTSYVYLAEGQTRLPALPRPPDVLLLDEAQRLTSRERARLLDLLRPDARRYIRLLLSSHEDLAPLFARRSLPLHTVHYDGLDEAHLHAVIRRRLDYFRLPDVPAVTIAPETLRYLWQSYGANLRAVEQVLYEVFQALRAGEAVAVDHVRLARERLSRPGP